MIQMYLHENAILWKLLDDVEFVSLRNVLDNLMKQRTAEGLGVRVSSNVISLEMEIQLFDKNVLGEESPLQLLQTVIYMLGLHLALRGGVEHCHLRRPGFNCQIQVELDSNGKRRLAYKEDPLQKTNQGGLTSKGTRKEVFVYEASDIRRCPVRLFRKYIGLLPEPKSCRKLYMRPKVKFTPSVWFNDQPYGNNKVFTTVKEICAKGGFEGKFTNHSLRASSASRLYQNDVPEQMIKEITGHRSDCVRTYKRTSDEIRESASKKLSGGNVSKKQKVEEKNVESENKIESKKSEELDAEFVKKTNEQLQESMSAVQMIRNVIKTKMELRKSKKTKGLECLKKVASKLVKKQKMKIAKKAQKDRMVIDMNVNLNIKK